MGSVKYRRSIESKCYIGLRRIVKRGGGNEGRTRLTVLVSKLKAVLGGLSRRTESETLSGTGVELGTDFW